MKKILVTLSLLILGGAVHANPNDVYLGTPNYGGTGCPAGSASVTLSTDQKSMSILFDNYVVEARGRNAIARKNCGIAVPVHIPQGYSVSVFKIDYRGFNSLPYGAMSRFNVEYFFAGLAGPSYTRTFNGVTNANYLLSNTLAASAVVWSRCGEQVILRANTNIFVRSNAQGEAALSTLDSVDLRSGLIYHLQWKRC